MNILLLNDNPVVTKLVTLSAQKVGYEISTVNNIDDIQDSSYDLVVVDDALYTKELMDELKQKISYKTSLYMVSRGAESVDQFDNELKKPFLPTDLVELFSSISNNLPLFDQAEEINLDQIKEMEVDLNKNLDFEDEIDIDIDNLGLKEDDFAVLDEINIEDDLDLNLDDIDLDDINLSDEEMGPILDQDEVQEVKNLLDETDINDDELAELEQLGDLNFDEDEAADETNLVNETEVPLELDELDLDELEDKIESAVSELTQEDLEQIVEIGDDLSELSALDEKSIKIALGEEADEIFNDEELTEEEFGSIENELEDVSLPEEREEMELEEEKVTPVDGVEALKALLKVLSNEDVAATLKGMNLSINISFGDKSEK